MTAPVPDLLATCWTSAGDASPLADQRSPLPVEDRVAALARGGWAEMGLVAADLRVVRDGIGFAALREVLDEAGVRCAEVELVDDWWRVGAARAGSDETLALLLDAATALGARHVKAGPPIGDGVPAWPDLVRPLGELTRVVADAGLRVALEPLPFSSVTTVPLGGRLVAEVDDPACGLCVDAWHVARGGTTPDELRSLPSGSVVCVELTDADAEVVGDLFEDTVDRRRYPGEGSVDLVGIVRALSDHGFTGPWGVEMLSREHRAGPVDAVLARAHRTASDVLHRALAGDA